MMNRRTFLRSSSVLGLASASVSSSLLQLGLARNVAAQQAQDYRALVCILFAGGNDSYNMLVPLDADQHAQYAALRSDLALPREGLLPLDAETAQGRRYGLHPGMAGVQGLVNGGDAAMLCNVGTLLEPFNAQALANNTLSVPLGLFSHSDQISQWQTAVSDERITVGWGGRVADLLQGQNLANGVSMNISTAGNNVFQSGETVSEYSVQLDGDIDFGINGYSQPGDFGDFRRSTLDAILAIEQPQLLRREYRDRLRGAIDSQLVFSAALDQVPALATPFSATPFSQALHQVARVISAREDLGASRQTFFIQFGGWDHHDEVLANQANMLPVVSQGLVEFRQALAELGVFDQVTTFTTSDFGRTLTSNGRGSDHGWGGHHIVMGGAVNGGAFYGDYPELQPASELDVGRGIYAPTTAIDQYFAELALWLGVAPGDLDTVLPNVRNFYSPESGDSPLGFLNSA
jgi:uncharacterized protein (DUF1501 family)